MAEIWNLRDARLADLGFANSATYLKSKHWQSIREAYFDPLRPCYCCAEADCDQELHHWTYANLGKETAADLIQVCGQCHQRIHGIVSAALADLNDAHDVLRDQTIANGEYAVDVPLKPYRAAKQRAKRKALPALTTFDTKPTFARRVRKALRTVIGA